jgi:hypothetical protein
LSSLLAQLPLLLLVLPFVKPALLLSLPSLLFEQALLCEVSTLLFSALTLQFLLLVVLSPLLADATSFLRLALLIKATAVFLLSASLYLVIAPLGFGLSLLIKTAAVRFPLPVPFLVLTRLFGVAALLFSLPPLLFLVLSPGLKSLLFLSLAFGLALLVGLPPILVLGLPFIGAALFFSLPSLLFLCLSFVIVALSLSLRGFGFLLLVLLLSLLPGPPLPIRTVFGFLSPHETCARESQSAKDHQDCKTPNVISFHECLLVLGRGADGKVTTASLVASGIPRIANVTGNSGGSLC